LQSSISHTMVDMFPALTDGASASGITYQTNFGQRPFAYTPPTGFKALNTQNLPDAPIKKGNQYFDATLYTGNGSTQSIVNSGAMQPDLVWLKGRSAATGNLLEDSVRGALQYLASETTAAESTVAGTITSFNSNGFSIGNQAGVNTNAATYVAWQWNAGGTTVTNTDGIISAQVRANPTAGFSVVTYTGTGANATVGHGLGVAPRMVIVKSRNAANNWSVWHGTISGSQFLLLNTTGVVATAANVWNSTTPTSTVFSVGTNVSTNFNTTTYVAYCFSEVAGYSAFGKYTGNGAADGPFVHLGFRPKFIIIKRTDVANAWIMFDTSRSTYNQSFNYLLAENTQQEITTSGATDTLDFLSNGFKLRCATPAENINNGTYVYMAFAENPFKNSLAR